MKQHYCYCCGEDNIAVYPHGDEWVCAECLERILRKEGRFSVWLRKPRYEQFGEDCRKDRLS